jgi:hypothetical protein
MKILAISLISCICFAACSNPAPGADNSASTEQKPEQKASDDEKPISVSAKEYDKKYQDNEVAADNLYKGKKIEITGKIESISKDIADDVYISLAGAGDDVSMGIQCHLSDPAKAADLKKGQSVTIVGTGDGMVVTIPQLKDCSIK